MIPSTGGRFEITVGGKSIYSKLETGDFPDEQKVLNWCIRHDLLTVAVF